jgi:hypothetical protein
LLNITAAAAAVQAPQVCGASVKNDFDIFLLHRSMWLLLLPLLLLCRRLSFAEFRRFFMLLPQQGQLVEYWLSGAAALQCADMGGHFSILERNRHSGAPWGKQNNCLLLIQAHGCASY